MVVHASAWRNERHRGAEVGRKGKQVPLLGVRGGCGGRGCYRGGREPGSSGMGGEQEQLSWQVPMASGAWTPDPDSRWGLARRRLDMSGAHAETQ